MLTLELISCDDEKFLVDAAVMRCSGTIKTMIDLYQDMKDNDADEMIPLPNVHSRILALVIKWAAHHKHDSKKIDVDEFQLEKRTDDISAWDAEFLPADQGTLFSLILAANYLDIKALLEVTCKTVANMIRGKTPEEIRKTFKIKNDFGQEEEEQVRREHEWCEEK